MHQRSPKLLFVLLAAASGGLHAEETAGRIGCPASTPVRTEHFAALRFRESPLESLAGVHRMDPAEVRQRNHWRFDYDAQGQLRRVRFMLGDRVREVNDQGNFFIDNPDIEICTMGGQEIRHFRNASGQPAYSRGNVAEERYSRDADGRMTAVTHHDADGRAIDNGWGIARYRWRHQHDGSVIETRENLAGASVAMRPNLPFHRLRLQFGPDGNLALMSQVDESGALVANELGAAQDRLEYDADGQMLAWNVHDATEQRVSGNEPRVARGVRSFGPDGLQSGERYEDPQGRPMSASWGSRVEFMDRDRFGNVTAQGNRDDRGNAATNPATGCATLRMHWSADGLHRTQFACFDAANQPATMVEGGFHRLTEILDAEGRVAEMRFEDRTGALVNRPDGVARVVHRYDEQGRTASRAFFNASGKPVEVRGSTVIPNRYRPDGYPER